MTTHADLAARLLRDAASFFRTLGNEQPVLKDQMEENADVFEKVADLVEAEPNGEVPD